MVSLKTSYSNKEKLFRIRLDVDHHVIGVLHRGKEGTLHGGGYIVALGDGESGIYHHDHIDHDVGALLLGADVLNGFHAFHSGAGFLDLLQDFLVAGSGHDLIQAVLGNIQSHVHDEEGNHNAAHGVQHGEAQQSAADTDHGADGRVHVRAVIPGVGDQGGAVDALAHLVGGAEHPFLGGDGNNRGDKSDHAGGLDGLAVHKVAVNGLAAGGEDAQAGDEQHHGADQGGNDLGAAVAVGMMLVTGLLGDLHAGEHNAGSNDVGSGMGSVGHHGGAVAQNTGYVLKGSQEKVAGHTDDGPALTGLEVVGQDLLLLLLIGGEHGGAVLCFLHE